jgi:hypothetical protein
MAVFVKMLGQLRPANTTAAAVYTKAQDSKVWLDRLFICNTTGIDATCRVFVDEDGSTYDETTAIAFDKVVPLDDYITINFDGKAYLDTTSGTVGVATGTNDALTFTLFGQELF